MLDNDSAQHLKLRERQRFYEEVYQHDVDNYLPSARLQIDCKKRERSSVMTGLSAHKSSDNIANSSVFNSFMMYPYNLTYWWEIMKQ